MKKGLLIAVAALLLLGSCSNEENSGTNADSAALKITAATLESAFTRGANVLSQGSIGVFLKGDQVYTAQNNVAYAYTDGSGWGSETPILISAANATLAAYYPYSAALSGTGVSMTSGIYSQASDLCYSDTTLNCGSPQWGINMKHAYALVTLNVSCKSEYAGTGEMSLIGIINSTLNSSGTLDLLSGEYSDLKQDQLLLYTLPESMVLSATAQAFNFLVVPSTLTGSLTLGVRIDNKEFEVNIPLADYNLPAFEAGQQYIFNLALRGTALSVSSISVKNWTQVSVPGTNVLVPVAD